jgi:hypothetical protein
MLARSEDMPPPAGRAPGREQLDLYSLTIERSSSGAERLSLKPWSIDLLTEAPRRRNVSQPAGDKL